MADGHHRTAAAVRLHAARAGLPADEAGETDGFLAVVFPAAELTVLPYHRLVLDLRGMSPEELLERLRERFEVEAADTPVQPSQPSEFGLRTGLGWHRVRLRDRAAVAGGVQGLAVSLLQDLVLAPVLGVEDPRRDPRLAFVGGPDGLAELDAAVAARRCGSRLRAGADAARRARRRQRRGRGDAAEVDVVLAEAGERPARAPAALTLRGAAQNGGMTTAVSSTGASVRPASRRPSAPRVCRHARAAPGARWRTGPRWTGSSTATGPSRPAPASGWPSGPRTSSGPRAARRSGAGRLRARPGSSPSTPRAGGTADVQGMCTYEDLVGGDAAEGVHAAGRPATADHHPRRRRDRARHRVDLVPQRAAARVRARARRAHRRRRRRDGEAAGRARRPLHAASRTPTAASGTPSGCASSWSRCSPYVALRNVRFASPEELADAIALIVAGAHVRRRGGRVPRRGDVLGRRRAT